MNEEVEKYLYDISACLIRLEKHIINCTTFFDFEINETVIKAVEREFEIIGEALRNIRKIDSDILISDQRKIIGLRNIIAHSYDSVEPSQLWGILKNHIPKLKSEVEELMKKFD